MTIQGSQIPGAKSERPAQLEPVDDRMCFRFADLAPLSADLEGIGDGSKQDYMISNQLATAFAVWLHL